MDTRRLLRNDTELAATTFVVIDFETTTPRGAPAEPIDVAAVAVRLAGHHWTETFRFSRLIRPPEHAPVTAFDTGQTGITPEMVAKADPAAAVLTELDAHVTDDGSYLLVAHNASTEAGLIYNYRHACPNLAHLDLLDTVRLARAVYPELTSHRLDALLAHTGIPQPTNRHRALPDVQVTRALFSRMLGQAESARIWSSLADVRAAGLRVARAKQEEQIATKSAQQDSLFEWETMP
jgi:DNA polymerase III alpha subunit (gram-positive type)